VNHQPSLEHKKEMKSLLAVFITAAIKMDPEGFKDPELDVKLGSVIAALLAAYNLGKGSKNATEN